MCFGHLRHVILQRPDYVVFICQHLLKLLVNLQSQCNDVIWTGLSSSVHIRLACYIVCTKTSTAGDIVSACAPSGQLTSKWAAHSAHISLQLMPFTGRKDSPSFSPAAVLLGPSALLLILLLIEPLSFLGHPTVLQPAVQEASS